MLMIFVIITGTNASLFNRKKMTSSSGLKANQESLHQSSMTKPSRGKTTLRPGNGLSLKGHLENVNDGYNWLIDGVGQILLAIDNIAVEDQMLFEMDDRLILLYKYYEEDIDQLLTYCKQVTDTGVMNSLKREGNLDTNEEFIVIENLPEPDENNKGEWATLQELLW